jgi:hypothetical protein
LLVTREITISQCQANGPAWLEPAQKTKKPIRLTMGKAGRRSCPAAPEGPAGDWLGSMKDSVKVVGDIVSSANDKNDKSE